MSTATARIVTALDEGAVIAAADELVAAGVEAICVTFLFSFLEPAHELARPRPHQHERHRDVFVSLSSEVDPTFREYERTVVTAFDAYVKPVVDRYLANLDRGLAQPPMCRRRCRSCSRAAGLPARSRACQRPVRMFLSGPAAGVIGARITGIEGRLAGPDHRRCRRHLQRHRAHPATASRR
jgi:N-methylhydantoinase A